MRALYVLVLQSGCGASYDLAMGEANSSGWSATDAGDYGAPSMTTSPPPPEDESDRLRSVPAQTDVYVFIANPDRDTLTRVHVATSSVVTTTVGVTPTLVVTTPDYQTAVVLNGGDDTISLVDAPTLDQTVVPVRPNLNRLDLSPDGRWAIAWHDAFTEIEEDPPEGVVSFNEASLVEVATGQHVPMIVGYRPRSVAFTADGRLAALISDDYVAAIDLTVGSPTPKLIELDPGAIDPPTAEEMILDASGTWAFVRQFGSNDIRVVDLISSDVGSVPVGANPTDMDLTPDAGQAAIVARDAAELWLLDAADPYAPAEILDIPPGAEAGQVLFDATGQTAVLFTTAVAVDRYATWNLSSDVLVERALVKPADTVTLAPGGETLVVFHSKTDAPETDPAFQGEWAVSMIDLGNFVASPVVLPSAATGYAHSNNGELGYFMMDGEMTLVRLDYQTLLFHEIALLSEPEFLGVLPDLDPTDDDQPATWASQVHDLGRISFYDPDDDTLETLTGFELNAGIED